jgi:hypothetical protein
MKSFKAQQACLICIVILSVFIFISSSLVYGASNEQVSDHNTPDAIVTAALFAGLGGAGMADQGIYTVVNGDTGTTEASALVPGSHDKGAVSAETNSNSGTVHRTIRRAHTACQDSCSL